MELGELSEPRHQTLSSLVGSGHETTPARLKIETDFIRQVIVNNKNLSTCLARHEGTATDVNKKSE